MSKETYKGHEIALVRGGYAISWVSIASSYDAAVALAIPFGGRRYRGKDFGGGIAFDTLPYAKEFLDHYKDIEPPYGEILTTRLTILDRELKPKK